MTILARFMALFIKCVQIVILLTWNRPRCFILHRCQNLSTCVIIFLLVYRWLLTIFCHDMLTAWATHCSQFVVLMSSVQIIPKHMKSCFVGWCFLFLHVILYLDKRTLNASLSILWRLGCLYPWIDRQWWFHILWRTCVYGNMLYLS